MKAFYKEIIFRCHMFHCSTFSRSHSGCVFFCPHGHRQCKKGVDMLFFREFLRNSCFCLLQNSILIISYSVITCKTP